MALAGKGALKDILSTRRQHSFVNTVSYPVVYLGYGVLNAGVVSVRVIIHANNDSFGNPKLCFVPVDRDLLAKLISGARDGKVKWVHV